MLFSFYISMSIFCIFCGDCGNKITKVVIQCQILYVGGENEILFDSPHVIIKDIEMVSYLSDLSSER